MLQVPINETESLYVSFTDDCEPNVGGFYCEIYNELDENIDNFVIHKEDLPNADYNEKMKTAKSLAFNYVIDSLR